MYTYLFCAELWEKVCFTFRIAIVVGALCSHLAMGQTITVHVEGIHGKHGRLRVGLWNSMIGFPSENPTRSLWVSCATLVGDKATMVFDAVPRGEYAVAVMHDENGNGKLDVNVFGKPKEGWAVSNNVNHRMHPPTYNEAKFELSNSAAVLSLSLLY